MEKISENFVQIYTYVFLVIHISRFKGPFVTERHVSVICVVKQNGGYVP